MTLGNYFPRFNTVYWSPSILNFQGTPKSTMTSPASSTAVVINEHSGTTKVHTKYIDTLFHGSF